jgi:t-SNARE complex subunit (syntaxin)
MIDEYKKGVLLHHAYHTNANGDLLINEAFNEATQSLIELGYIHNERITSKGIREMGCPMRPVRRARLIGIVMFSIAALAVIVVLALAIDTALHVMEVREIIK